MGTGTIRRWRKVVSMILFFLAAFSFVPPKGYANDPPPAGSETIDPSRFFTITRIEPNPAQQSLTITFSETCPIAELKNLLKISPPARWEFSGSLSGLSISPKGHFLPGQDYGVFLPETFKCNGRRYRETLHRFRWPDLEPAIRYSENETVVEPGRPFLTKPLILWSFSSAAPRIAQEFIERRSISLSSGGLKGSSGPIHRDSP